MVKQMPTIAANQQPTIAIITALYHEKVAVDAMMENKTTYVRYKTEGQCCFEMGMVVERMDGSLRTFGGNCCPRHFCSTLIGCFLKGVFIIIIFVKIVVGTSSKKK